jgi:hypothetical protein
MAKFFRNTNWNGDPAKDTLSATLGKVNSLPPEWNRAIKGLTVQQGYTMVLYDLPYLQTNKQPVKGQYGNSFSFEPGTYPDLGKIVRGAGEKYGWYNATQSYHLYKDCEQSQWAWDTDCMNPDDNTVVGNCNDHSSKCYQNRLYQCSTMTDLDKNCVDFCSKNHGECDQGMIRYCLKPENKDRAVCKCINSPAKKWNPRCMDTGCILDGYTTKSMMEGTCPDVIDCSIYNQINNEGGTMVFSDDVQQRCGQGPAGQPGQPGQPDSTTQASGNPPVSMLSMLMSNIWSLLAIVMLVILLLVVLWWGMSRSSARIQTGI